MLAQLPANTIRTILVDDHAIVRAGIALICKGIPDIEIVGEAETGKKGVKLIRDHNPDLVILDFKLPDISGVEVIRRLAKTNTHTKILILTSEAYALISDWFLVAGAHGCLEKTATPEQFKQAITAVLTHPFSKKDWLSEGLFLRELEVLQMMIYGHTIQYIASRLYLDLKTIYAYRSRIFKKFKVKNSVELALLALRKRWTALEDF